MIRALSLPLAMEKSIVSSTMTTTSDHHCSSGRVASHPMCARCHHCALCNCRECQLRLCVEYCTACRCYWRPTYCTVCGKHTGYTQTCYPPLYGCTKPCPTPASACIPSCCPQTCYPPACSCMPACSPPACVACSPPACVQTVSQPCGSGRRTGYTQTCYQPPAYTPKTYCVICHKYV